MKRKSCLKFISCLLASIMLLSSIPTYALTNLFDSTIKNSKEVDDTVFIIEEDTTKRNEHEKHYLCSDGTFIAVSYPEAIHCLDNNGQWVNVDNTLSMNRLTQQYETRNSNYKVTFANQTSAQKLIEMSNGTYTLSWRLSAVEKDNIELSMKTAQSMVESSPATYSKVQKSSQLISEASTFELPNTVSKISYDNIFAGNSNISVKYTVYQNKVEEDIIINEKSDIDSFVIRVGLTDLTPILKKDNAVEFIDDIGEMQYRIGIPYMVDANDEVLSDIVVSINKTTNGYDIIYTPNKEWLQSDSRVYPIMLDPSITTNEYSSYIDDTYISENDTSNHSSEQRLYVGIKNQKTTRIYMRINHLPAIDASMPILSATMTLKLWYGTSTGKQLSIYKAGDVWDPNTITYSTQPVRGALLSTSNFNSSTLLHTFDLTENVAKLYDEYLAGANFGYCIQYTDESKTNPDYNSIYSSEMTTVSYKPYLTVKYGYVLPSDLKNGGIYSLQNSENMNFATVHEGNDTNNTNVYQYNNLIPDITVNQQFKLEYVPSTGGYMFRAMCSSNGTNRVLDIQRGGGEIYSGRNVQLYSATDPISQEWLIVGTSNSTYKILPRSNMSLALTAVEGYSNGSSTGTSSISSGNIFVSSLSDSKYQEWYIVESGSYVWYSGLGFTVPNEIYYFNNGYSSKYFHKNGSSVNQASGYIVNLRNSIRWKVTHLGGKEYTIQSTDNMLYLTSSSTSVSLQSLSDDSIPTSYRWNITGAAQGGCLIKNVYTQKYLYANGETTISTSPTLGTANTETYNRRVWRIANVHYYGNTSDCDKRELSSYSVNNISIDIGECIDPKITAYPSNAIWVSSNEFKYSTGNSYYIDTLTGTIIGGQSGTESVTVTHKTTNRQSNFSITVSDYLLSASCPMGENYHITYTLAHGASAILNNATWASSNTSVATINSSGIITGITSGYTFISATTPDGLIVFMCELKVTDPHTQMIATFTQNEIQYLYCPSSYLNLWTNGLPNAFALKVEILYTLRNYYTLPENQQPSQAEIQSILKNQLNITADTRMAAAMFNECYLGYKGLYNQEYLTNLRKQYFNTLKQFVTICAFTMAANLDPVNTLSQCQGINDFKEDLAREWTNNSSSDKFMLGSRNYNGVDYADRARALDCSYFYSNEYDFIKNNYGNNYVREINQIALNRALQSNKQILFSHDPRLAPSFTSLYMEYQQVQNYYSAIGKTTNLTETQVLIDGILCTIWKLVVIG